MKKAVICGIALWLAVNAALGCVAAANYRQKLEILSLMLAEDSVKKESSAPLEDEEERETGLLELVTQYLKGDAASAVREGYERLEELGYSESFRSPARNRFLQDIFMNAVVTGAAFAVFLASLFYQRYSSRKKEEILIRKLCGMISAVKSDDFERAFPEGGGPEKACLSDKDGDGALKGDWLRVREELGTLASHISLMREAARKDREETKTLVTDISHQLRTPLTALQTSFDLLQSGTLQGQEWDEFLVRCSVQLERLLELTGALLQISRLEMGLIDIRMQKAALFDTILTAVNRIYPQAQDKGIEIIFEESQENAQDVVLSHDPKWLSEALINVLENAVKYSADRTAVRIRVRRMPVSIRIEIEDEGIGIGTEERSRIFKRFYRAQDGRVQSEKGQGIGLYLTRQIVEYHHGTIKVVPAVPAGSIFVIQLPV